MEHFIQFYKQLLGSPAPKTSSVRAEILALGHKLDLPKKMGLMKSFTVGDIKRVVFSIHHAKSLGHDGYSSVIGLEISEPVLEFFHGGRMLKNINHTMLVVLAKKKNRQNAQEFRLLACCTVLFTIISKLFCQRLKEVLPELVNLNQGAFVQGCLILHNIFFKQRVDAGL